MITNKTLAKIAIIGGFVTISSGFYVNRRIQERIRSTAYYRNAMKIVRHHRGAIALLGEPIRAGNIDLGNTDINFCDGHQAQFKIPVNGPNCKGSVFLWARSVNDMKEWNIYRLELELKDDDSKRLAIIRETLNGEIDKSK